MMENIIKVHAIQDESSHWYLIPTEMQSEFRRLHEEENYEEFNEKFAHYRTGGDLNNKQLYIISDSDTDKVVISKEEYDAMKKDSRMLIALHGAGVDNWDGYDYAMEYMNENND